MKRLLALLMTLLLLGSTAAADTIDVFYNDIQVYINGALTSFSDSAGNPTEPFIHNGGVYLPLSAIAQALNVPYAWDGSTMSAYLGAKPGAKQYLMDICPPYESNDFKFALPSEGTSFAMAGQKYTNGMQRGNTGGDAYALFNLNGRFSSLSFTAGHVDQGSMRDSRILIYLDGRLAKEIDVFAEGLPFRVDVALNHALSMKIVAEGGSFSCGLADIVVE